MSPVNRREAQRQTALVCVEQACTTYGPRKLLIWPAKPKIVSFMDVFHVKCFIKGVKSYQFCPLDDQQMGKKNCLARHQN